MNGPMSSRRQRSTLCLTDIQRFFEKPQLQYLGLELAVCWVLECLLEEDNYPTVLMAQLAQRHPRLRLSETVLQQAIEFLDRQGAITSYSQRCPSRGRPRRMLHLAEAVHGEANALVTSWHSWLEETHHQADAAAAGVGNGLSLEDQRLADELRAERGDLHDLAHTTS